MKTIKTKSISFLFLFLLIFIPTINAFSINVSGSTPVITTDIFRATADPFIDITTNDGTGGQQIETGGFDLLEFESTGTRLADDGVNILFMADSLWGFEANIYSNVLLSDMFTYFKQESKSFQFLDGTTYKHHKSLLGFCFQSTDISSIKKYTATSVYGDLGLGGFLAHDYNGHYPLNVMLEPGLQFTDIEVGEIKFTAPKMWFNVQRVIVTESREGECGSYEDFYTSEGGDTANVTINIIDDDLSDVVKNTVGDYFAGQAGFKAQRVNEYDPQNTYPGGEGTIDAVSVGADLPKISTNKFSLYSRIKPDVQQRFGEIDYNKLTFTYLTCCESFPFGPELKTVTVSRRVSAHVYNSFTHLEFKVPIELQMTCQVDAELSQTVLNDPDFTISDAYWYIALSKDGNYKGDIYEPPDEPDWLLIIIIILIVCVGIYIVYKIYSRRVQQTFMLRLAGRR